MNDGQTILEARHLIVRRGGVTVLDIDALSVEAGHILALIGPNGTGKSTLLLTLACLLRPVRGEILFKGVKVLSNNHLFSYRRHLAMVFQDPLLFDATVFDNVASGLKIRKVKSTEIKQRVDESLEQFGIGHLIRRSARKLSGGEAQRTSLARAFAIRPEIIFLDEPFASLDPPTRESLIEDLQRILRETGTTAVMATHDQQEALRLSDRMGVMNDGRIIQAGPPVEIISRPADEFVASFVGVETVLPGRVVSGQAGCLTVFVNGKSLEAVGDMPAGTEVVCCIRPENVTVTTTAATGETSARNVFPARVRKICPLGLFHKVTLDCGFPLIAYVTTPSVDNLSLREGKDVLAAFKATAVHVIRK